jgi:hypothetical protein
VEDMDMEGMIMVKDMMTRVVEREHGVGEAF